MGKASSNALLDQPAVAPFGRFRHQVCVAET